MQKSLKKNFVISLFRTLVVSITPIVIFPYAARILGSAGVGKVQYIQALAGFFQVFASFGVTTYGVKEGAKLRDNPKKLGAFTSEILIINLITTFVTLIVYTVLFFFDQFKSYRILMLLFIPYIFCYGMNLDWFFNTIEEYGYITKRTAVFYGIALLVMFLFLKDSKDINIYAIVLILPYIGMFATNIIRINKVVPLFKTHFSRLKTHFKSMFWFFAITLSINIYVLLDTVMLGILSNDSSVGLYTAASKLSRAIVQVFAAICTVFIPRLSYYIGQDKVDNYRNLLSKTMHFVLVIVIPASVGLYALSYEALVLYSGRKFVNALPSMELFALFLPFSAINNFLGTQVLMPNDKEKNFFAATVTGAFIDVLLNIVFIPRWDFVGATIATFISEIIVFIICFCSAKKYIFLPSLIKIVIQCIVCSIPIIFIVNIIKVMHFSVFITSVMSILLSAIIYYILLIIFRDSIIKEINIIIIKLFKSIFLKSKKN